MSPPEMRAWDDKLRSYYLTSHMELLHIYARKSFFIGRMEGELLITIKKRIARALTIDICCERLEERYLELYPLFGRRLVFKQLKKKSSQELADRYSQLRCVGDEAELDKLTVDEQYRAL